ncbi:hypothetical protein BDZ97DRAFT_1799406 [Flammula alnicola]|nr:hypothetical protein BDZ97DRAFT_1799406 [Flammula alnicola]
MEEAKLGSEDSTGRLPRNVFLDLPNEVIIYVLDHLDEDDLYRLALVSRRIHHLSLPLYLARKGFGSRPNDQLVTFNYNAQAILRAVQIALFRPSLTRLHYSIDCQKTQKELFKEIEILRCALEKLSGLQEMILSFQNTAPPLSPQNLLSVPLSDCSYGFPGGLKSPIFVSLLESILSSGCQSLYPALRYIGPSLAQEFSGIYGLSNGFLRSLRSWAGIGMFNIFSSRVKNNLDSFHFHSPMALHPHLCRWMIDTLNYSAITTISISQHQSTDEHSWALVLPCVYIPTLTNFTIDFTTIHLSTFLEFLGRHHRIHKLYIGRNFLFPTPPHTHPVFPKKILGQLTHLTAPLNRLNYFFSSHGSLPSLSHTTILMLINPRLKAMKELHLALSFGSASSDWMNPSSYADAPDAAKTGVRAFITHMQLYIKMYSLPSHMASRLPKWLAQFPSVRHLTLLTLSEKGPPLSPEREIVTRAVMESCPKIDSVKFRLIEET